MAKKNYKIAFFGGEPLGLPTLEALYNAGIIPELVICNPDRKSGRGQILTATRLKVWATEHNIEVFQPTTYKDKEALTRLTETTWDLFVVVAYNFILPSGSSNFPSSGLSMSILHYYLSSAVPVRFAPLFLKIFKIRSALVSCLWMK